MATTSAATFERILAAVGSQSELASRLSGPGRQLSRSAISQWRRRGSIPAEWVLPIERATRGQVTRHEMRPDLYPVERVA